MDANISCEINRIRNYNEETGHAIVECTDMVSSLPVIALGALLSANVGDTYKLRGVWKNHHTFGRQFVFTDAKPIMPVTREGIATWLSSVADGVGMVKANSLIEAMGEDCIQKIKEGGVEAIMASTLKSSHPMNERMAKEINDAIQSKEVLARLMELIGGSGIGTATAIKIYKKMGDTCISQIKKNPYCLAEEIDGIGFKMADSIARRKLKVTKNSPFRYQSAVRFALISSTQDGHTCLTPTELLERVKILLGVDTFIDKSDIKAACMELESRGQIVIDAEGGFVYYKKMFNAETRLAKKLSELASGWKWEIDEAEIDITFNKIQELMVERDREQRIQNGNYDPDAEPVVLDETQRKAIRMALVEPICVITGGPGTGKTTITKGILDADEFTDPYRVFHLASPTGKAAKRLSEVCGKQAQTIHRLLSFSWMGGKSKGFFNKNHDDPLEHGRIVIDEASMLDVNLADSLFNAIQCDPYTQVVVVGDIEQLPSVGPGSVLRDMIKSGKIPVQELTYNYRQHAKGIPEIASEVAKGRFPTINSALDYNPLEAKDAAAALELVKQSVERCLREGIDCMDFQVLAPMYAGACGVDVLNEVIQEIVNPLSDGEEELSVVSKTIDAKYRVGDKVMVLKNDYNREVFNGDQGKIIALSTEEKDKHIVVEFMDSDGTAFDTKYTLDELRGEKSITLSYATTVHKSQGSEYKVVILVILSSHHLLLKRNLFYTGITRARDRLDLVYDKRAANTAARTEDSLKRNSLLKERVVANYDARNCGNEVGKLPKPQGHIDQVQSGIEHSDGGEQQWEDQPF